MLPITAIHDQERLLLPAFLQLAVLAGGIRVAVRLAGAVRPAAGAEASVGELTRSLGVGLAVLLLLPGLLGITRLHPFELSYYSELVGGTSGAERSGMETTYYASTYGHLARAQQPSRRQQALGDAEQLGRHVLLPT